MTKPEEVDKPKPSMQLGNRKKLGWVNTEKNLQESLDGLTPKQQAMREAAIKQFKVNKVRAFISEQVKYLNLNRQIGDSIRFFFDKNGKPPVNLPLEDIIAERKKIEAQIHWFEALCSEMRNNLSKIKEIEDHAIEFISQDKD